VAWRNYDGAASAFALASDGLGLRGNEAIAGGICEALLKGPSGNEAPFIESRLQARVFELVRNIYAAPKMLILLDVRATHLATQITVMRLAGRLANNVANKTSPLLELARVLVRVDHIASVIVNANHSVM
jgi:hypothetical protein